MRREFTIDYLQYYGLISRYIVANTDLKRADLEILFYMNGLKYFTMPEFKKGELLYSWDRPRFYRLQETGWIKKVATERNKHGHFKFTVSQKAKNMFRRIERLIDGKEVLPVTKRKTHKQKVQEALIRKFNQED